jgi:2-isopropylmalate synthase
MWDWNGARELSAKSIQDETLRDGLQSPSVTNPGIADKIELLHAMDSIGIDVANVGFPAASPRRREHVEALCREIVRAKLRVRPAAAGRTLIADLVPIVEASQASGIAIEVCTFIGSSPIRKLAEEWSIERILRQSGEAIGFAVREGLEVCYVTEDTTRSRPEHLAALYRNALDHGARRLCLADTVGYATPDGARALVEFTRHVIAAGGYRDVGLDWHGHNDRGLSLMNSLSALAAGADRVHGCAHGIGERSGNARIEHLLVNLRPEVNAAALSDYSAIAVRALQWMVQPPSVAASVPASPAAHIKPSTSF